jgi:hypothetical protein
MGLGVGVGDMALLSLDGQHVAAARVIVHTLSDVRVTVTSSKPLRLHRFSGGAQEAAQQLPGGWAEAGVQATQQLRGSQACAPTWRLDRDEAASTATLLRSNVLALVGSPDQGAERLRRLVVDGEAPRARAGGAQAALRASAVERWGRAGGGGRGPGARDAFHCACLAAGCPASVVAPPVAPAWLGCRSLQVPGAAWWRHEC